MKVANLKRNKNNKAMNGENKHIKRYAESSSFIADNQGKRLADAQGSRIKTKR